MKISNTTIKILKDLARYNPHIVIQSGNVIKTVNDRKTVFIKAVVEEEFPTEIALHDLSGFLRVVTLFNEPDFEFNVDHVIISDDSGSQQEYQYSDKEDLMYDERNVYFPETDIVLEISEGKFDKVIKACNTNKVEDIAIVGEGRGGVSIKALNKEQPTRVFSTLISRDDLGEFTVYLKPTIKLLSKVDYVLEISDQKIVRFSAKVGDAEVSYIVAAEVDSEF